MAWTKKQLVIQAFEEIGYASYIYDAMPEQLESVLRSLDTMMATWYGEGIALGYSLPSKPENSNLDDSSNLPDAVNEAVYTNLAIRIAPRFGKTVAPETTKIAKQSYDSFLIGISHPIPMQYPSNLPIGAGAKPWRRSNQPFVNPPTDYLTNGDKDVIDLN